MKAGFYQKQEGATAVEYALLIALIAVVIIAGVSALGTNINVKLNQAATAINSGVGGGGGGGGGDDPGGRIPPRPRPIEPPIPVPIEPGPVPPDLQRPPTTRPPVAGLPVEPPQAE